LQDLPRTTDADTPKGILLPRLYDPFVFTEEEKIRFLAALKDGFFGVRFGGAPYEEVALPATVEAGLLPHRAFYDRTTHAEFQNGDKTQAFWKDLDEAGEPGLFRLSPINFDFDLIEVYFLEQKLAFFETVLTPEQYKQVLEQVIFSEYKDELSEENRRYERALDRPYSKCWYEHHINQQIYLIKDSLKQVPRLRGTDQQREVAFVVTASAKLGRLVEQYYWKLLLEKAAIRGGKSNAGAKVGGLMRASGQKDVRRIWQAEARKYGAQLTKRSRSLSGRAWLSTPVRGDGLNVPAAMKSFGSRSFSARLSTKSNGH
jgi:hypothetical protein